jgi:hypothetical protein
LRLFPGKLRSRWFGPYTVSQVFPHGALEVSKEDGTTFKVNGQRAKHYEEGMLQVSYVTRLSDWKLFPGSFLLPSHTYFTYFCLVNFFLHWGPCLLLVWGREYFVNIMWIFFLTLPSILADGKFSGLFWLSYA